LNNLDSHVAALLAFFQSWKQKKSHGERSGEYGGCGSTVTLCLVRNLEMLFISDVQILTAKIATGKGHGDFRLVLPPSGGRAT
jgi:hypothetical protein